MIDHTNLEDYADRVLFDLENGSFEPDGPFYLSLCKQVGGSVLELGCGTGRSRFLLLDTGLILWGLMSCRGCLTRPEAMLETSHPVGRSRRA